MKKEALTVAEIRELTNKLETLLHKRIFNKIAKRSVDDDEIDQEAKIIKMFGRVKDLFDLNTHKEISEFKSKIMDLPEQTVPLRALMQLLRSETSENSECSKKTKVECPFGTKLRVVKASVSNKNKFSCPTTLTTLRQIEEMAGEICTEEKETMRIVKDKCDGERVCKLSVDADLSTVCKCAPQKYLNLTYVCEVSEEGINKLKRSSCNRSYFY